MLSRWPGVRPRTLELTCLKAGDTSPRKFVSFRLVSLGSLLNFLAAHPRPPDVLTITSHSVFITFLDFLLLLPASGCLSSLHLFLARKERSWGG